MSALSGTVPTWTRTLNERDGQDLLDAAEPQMSLADWRDRGDRRLPQSSVARRKELLREVERDLLDHDGEQIVDSVFLRLFQSQGPHVRQSLFLGRLLFARAGVASVVDELVLPAIARSEEPMGLPQDAHIPGDVWDAWLLDRLPAGTGETAFAKTRQTLQRHLAAAGVLALDDAPSVGATARRAQPAPVAFAWLVAFELQRQARTEAPVSWALRQSFASRLWATDEAWARACLESGASAGLLTLGYLAGEPRLHVQALQ